MVLLPAALLPAPGHLYPLNWRLITHKTALRLSVRQLSIISHLKQRRKFLFAPRSGLTDRQTRREGGWGGVVVEEREGYFLWNDE